FGGDQNLRASFYKEALLAVDKRNSTAIANKTINVSNAKMNLRHIKTFEAMYGKVGELIRILKERPQRVMKREIYLFFNFLNKKKKKYRVKNKLKKKKKKKSEKFE
ncbi:hypothetical protein, partial [Streptococcus pluranimalium]